MDDLLDPGQVMVYIPDFMEASFINDRILVGGRAWNGSRSWNCSGQTPH